MVSKTMILLRSPTLTIQPGTIVKANVTFRDNRDVAISMALASNPVITGGSYMNNAVNGVYLDAAYFGRLGERVVDIGALWSFEIQRANGIGPLKTLASVVDMSLAAVGLPLGIGRSFGSTILDRHVTGPFGNGWIMSTWSQTLAVRPDNTVVIRNPNSSQRVFQPDSRSNRYFAQAGDHSILSNLGGGTFTLMDPSGLVTQFISGRVGFVQDTNGNKTGTAPATKNALLTVTFPDSIQQVFAYDVQGRLDQSSLQGGTQAIDLQYGVAGMVAVANANNDTSNFFYDHRGLVSKQVNPTGRTLINDFDANGNLISRTDATGATTFTYNFDSQLVGIQPPTGSTSFQYDAFGSLYTETDNGQQRRSLVDPTARQIVGQFNAGGNVLAHYTHGAGLVSQVSNAGVPAYFDFDLRGSTAGLTNAAGTYVNTYSYLPFGGTLSSASTLANPFEFVGRYGVIAEPANLHLMDARFYDSAIGQFIADDPIGLAGGDVHLRRYVGNNPVTRVDPVRQSALDVISLIQGIRNRAEELLRETLRDLDFYTTNEREKISKQILRLYRIAAVFEGILENLIARDEGLALINGSTEPTPSAAAAVGIIVFGGGPTPPNAQPTALKPLLPLPPLPKPPATAQPARPTRPAAGHPCNHATSANTGLVILKLVTHCCFIHRVM